MKKLEDSAKSVDYQALQAAVGYSTKSTIASTAVTGANSSDLRGTPSAYTNATVTGSAIPGAAATTTKLTALTTATVADLLTAVDTITGTATASTLGGTALTLSTGTAQDLVIGGTAGTLTKLGLTAGTPARAGGVQVLNGLTLTIGATGNGTATNITFGDGTGGTVKSLNALNTKLASINLLATIDRAGVINITATNDAASSTIGAIGGTAAGAGKAFAGSTAAAPVQDAAAQLVRSNLVTQYNNILDQIT